MTSNLAAQPLPGTDADAAASPTPAAARLEPRDASNVQQAATKPAYEASVGALVQADGRQYIGDHERNTALLRRARPIVTGTVLSLVDFNLTADFGGGQVGLTDAYLNPRPWPWLQLRVGKFKPPIGLERLQSDANLPLPERALTANLSATRDVGAQVWGVFAEGFLTYAFAVLDGAGNNANIDQDAGGDKDFAARLFVEPLHAVPRYGVLGLGIAGTLGHRSGDPDATGLSSLRTPGQLTMFSYLAPSDDADGAATVYATGSAQRLNLQAYYYQGPFGVLAETIWSRENVQKGASVATLTHHASHATVSYVFGGSNGYKGATPNRDWNLGSGELGAIELAVRVATIEFDPDTFPAYADPAVSVHGADNIGGAVNWALSRQVRLALNVEHTRFEGGSPGGRREDENFVLTRAQLAF